MRGLWLAILLAAPAAGAQAWEDPRDDHRFGVTPVHLSGQAHTAWADAPPDTMRDGDVLGFSWQEHEESIEVSFTLASPWLGGVLEHTATFDHRGQRYGISLLQSEARPEPAVAWGRVYTWHDGQQSVSPVHQVPAVQEGSVFTATLEKRRMIDDDRIPLRPGDVLADASWAIRRFGNPPLVCPILDPPNPGMGIGACDLQYADDVDIDDVAIRLAPAHQGHLLLDSLQPLRFSNGAATTYVIHGTLHNLAGPDDTVILEADGLPEGWAVVHPLRLELPAGGRLDFPVTLSVPFAHDHGAVETFTLRASSQEDPAIRSEIDLGVLWSEVPQPTAHHPLLHLHTQGIGYAHMSTVEREDEEMWSAQRTRCCRPAAQMYDVVQEFTFSNDLGVGLQFDGQAVEGELRVRAERPFSGNVSAWLTWSGQDDVAIASMAPMDVEWQEGQHDLAVSLPLADPELRIPHEARSFLRFHVEFRQQETPDFVVPSTDFGTSLRLLPGGWIRLPLGDFHEIDGAYSVGGLAWEDGARLVEVNPGRTTLWRGNLSNEGPDRTVRLDAASPGLDATVAPASARLRAGGTLEVVVRAAPAVDAPPGRIPVVVYAHDEEAMATMGFEVEVTSAHQIPDRAQEAADALDAAAESGKQTPAPWVGLVLLGALVLRRPTP